LSASPATRSTKSATPLHWGMHNIEKAASQHIGVQHNPAAQRRKHRNSFSSFRRVFPPFHVGDHYETITLFLQQGSATRAYVF
jgi:hypothetical protein